MSSVSPIQTRFDERYFTSDGYEGYYMESYQHLARSIVVPEMLGAIKPDPSWTFLEVGCAMGGNIIALREKGFAAFGAEVSPYCLEHSPVREWLQPGDVRALPFGDNTFDVVLCMEVFEYLSPGEVPVAARELCRVARRYVLLCVYEKNSEHWKQKDNPDPFRDDAHNVYDRPDFIRMFRERGMELVREDTITHEDWGQCFTPLFRKI